MDTRGKLLYYVETWYCFHFCSMELSMIFVKIWASNGAFNFKIERKKVKKKNGTRVQFEARKGKRKYGKLWVNFICRDYQVQIALHPTLYNHNTCLAYVFNSCDSIIMNLDMANKRYESFLNYSRSWNVRLMQMSRLTLELSAIKM